MINDGTFNAAQMMEGENEEDDMGDVASPEQMAMRGKGGKQPVNKKRSGGAGAGSGLGQRKVFNNFMNEN